MITIKERVQTRKFYDVQMSLPEHFFEALQQLAKTPCLCQRGYHCQQTGQVVAASEPDHVQKLRLMLLEAIENSQERE